MMPERFHPDIKNLIAGMINVDVDKRFSLEQIKNHRAFRFGLPNNYLVPRPIPFPDLSEPIDPDLVPQTMIETLNAIGIQTQEVREELALEGTNTTKIFISMMNEQTLISNLPWESAASEIPVYDESMENFGSGTIENARVINETLSPLMMQTPESGFSLAVPTPWFPEDPEIEFQKTLKFGPSSYWSETVMASLQSVFLEFGFLIFHPDPLTLFGKNATNMFIRIRVEFPETSSSILKLDLKNIDPRMEETLSSRIEDIYDSREN